MTFGSVCSGIEAASVAWNPLGWEAAWFSEIDRFPSLVLAHHYPEVPNLGDMTRIHERKEFSARPIDVLVGGTPCQSFSVAGKRGGMDDHRGNLALVFSRIARLARARWVVWENVPGVLSSNGGRDFAAFLRSLSECGYMGFYRTADAQYFGVPQRRRRVFVVGYLGDWRPAAAVLLERSSLSGNPPPRRKTWSETTGQFGEERERERESATRCGEVALMPQKTALAVELRSPFMARKTLTSSSTEREPSAETEGERRAFSIPGKSRPKRTARRRRPEFVTRSQRPQRPQRPSALAWSADSHRASVSAFKDFQTTTPQFPARKMGRATRRLAIPWRCR